MSKATDMENDDLNLSELIASIWAHKIIIILLTSLSIICAGYYSLTAQKKFTATSIFDIQDNSNTDFRLPGQFESLASLIGVNSSLNSNSKKILERAVTREFILIMVEKASLDQDPFFNTHNLNPKDDPLWKSTIKKIVGWKKIEAEPNAVAEEKIIRNYKTHVVFDETDTGAITISVTHIDRLKASEYANLIMEEMLNLIEYENDTSQQRRLSYLSQTLADALQDMEVAQGRLKEYALENSALANENFISGSLKLDETRMEKRKVEEIYDLLLILKDVIKRENLDENTYKILRSSHPLVDDIDFRRILGMSETISAWTWPKVELVEAVSATLKDRIKRLNMDIKNIEDSAKIYAESAEDLAKLKRNAKIAEATYTVLIEQVKSQSLAAGFRPDRFLVLEYATPPLSPSAPNRNRLLVLGALSGLAISFCVALLNSIRRGVYYTRSTLSADLNAQLSFKTKPIKKLARKSFSEMKSFISKDNLPVIDQSNVKLANKKIVYICNSNSYTQPYNVARLMAIQSAKSGRKVLLYDVDGLSNKEIVNDPVEHISGLKIASIDENLKLVQEGENNAFLLNANFIKIITELLEKFDQVFISSKDNHTSLGLMALEDLSPGTILIGRLRRTKKSEIRDLKFKKPVEILLYD